MASKLTEQCILNGKISVTAGCCATVIITIDEDEKCLCDVTEEYELQQSLLSTEKLWDIYQTCGGRTQPPADTRECRRPTPPPPPLPPGGDSPLVLSPLAIFGIVAVSLAVLPGLALAILYVWRKVHSANVEQAPVRAPPATAAAVGAPAARDATVGAPLDVAMGPPFPSEAAKQAEEEAVVLVAEEAAEREDSVERDLSEAGDRGSEEAVARPVVPTLPIQPPPPTLPMTAAH
ncbi:hypothetical protein E2562_015425 [Oryza meyeriana var. granulata]|uniref:Bifunctional inhibitor/plant lipid transfer protein/seed storage helical domain-containing protein n=1 Tax=Oryza meyeriana var. granulata TaxID=110450 RepID=A0A6G1EKP1_9ORYZ|nr:hypothetical protein E2562_015425 [Oryza meyeriana var. granulata]